MVLEGISVQELLVLADQGAFTTHKLWMFLGVNSCKNYFQTQIHNDVNNQHKHWIFPGTVLSQWLLRFIYPCKLQQFCLCVVKLNNLTVNIPSREWSLSDARLWLRWCPWWHQHCGTNIVATVEHINNIVTSHCRTAWYSAPPTIYCIDTSQHSYSSVSHGYITNQCLWGAEREWLQYLLGYCMYVFQSLLVFAAIVCSRASVWKSFTTFGTALYPLMMKYAMDWGPDFMWCPWMQSNLVRCFVSSW